MIKPKEMNVLFLIICATILPSIYCQLSDTSSTLDVISDGFKSMLGLDQVVKTFKKISEGMIPFPLFVPIIPKNKVIELFKGKKSPKEPETLEQISESNAKLNNLNKLQIPLPLQQQLLAQLNPNFQQLNEQMFFNLRPPTPDISFIMNPGLVIPPIHAPTITDDVRPNDLNSENDYNEDNNNNYAERYGSGLQSDEYSNSDDRKPPSAQDVIHNWQIIDEELKKIGQQLGKLGKYLNRNSKL